MTRPPQTPQPPPDLPTPIPRVVICPFCGCHTKEAAACSECHGRFDPLSRQATQNSMGPWWVHDPKRPFTPGCSYSAILKRIEAGSVKPGTVIRGPSTRQFWMLAKHTPGIANLLGRCHNCELECADGAYACDGCGAVFAIDRDRQHLGLGPIRDLTPSTQNTFSTERSSTPGQKQPQSNRNASRAERGPPPTIAASVPRIRAISRQRIAVNWVVGIAVFTMVTGMVLSALEILPADLFQKSNLAGSPGLEIATKPMDLAESSVSANDPVGEGRSAELREEFQFSNPPDAVINSETRFAIKNDPPDADSQPVESVSREQRLKEDAIEVLRLGDPKALREMVSKMDTLIAAQRAPEWAPKLRHQLLLRLERGQFARLP